MITVAVSIKRPGEESTSVCLCVLVHVTQTAISEQEPFTKAVWGSERVSGPGSRVIAITLSC